MDKAKQWALRCHLELQNPKNRGTAVFTTLTYRNEEVPEFGSLNKNHVSEFMKRLRFHLSKHKREVRFFASGEYGERTERPHYHALLYGMSTQDGPLIEEVWGKGHAYTVNISPAAIAYVAGYCQKKLDWHNEYRQITDPATGELLWEREPPFRLMSRRPGIGGEARAHTHSWRLYAVLNGQRMPVPRYLHDAWKAQATPEDIARLEQERASLPRQGADILTDTGKRELIAKEANLLAKQALKAAYRKYA